MQYPTFAQLAAMAPEQRAQRLRGTPAPYRDRMLKEAAQFLAEIVNEGLRTSSN